MFVARLDVLRHFISTQLTAFEFSYIFILYGFDLINQNGKPSLDSTRNLKSWFETNLAGHELHKSKEECTYKYLIPQFVVVTIPEVSFDFIFTHLRNSEIKIYFFTLKNIAF